VVFTDAVKNEKEQGSWLVLIDKTMPNYQLVLLQFSPFAT
jgi:hypothetical protein